MAPKNERYTVTVQVNVEDAEHLDKLIKRLEAMRKAAPKGDPFKELTAGAKKTAKESRFLGRNLQNASYQIQDFVTQVSNGVSPLVSFGQQMPQLLINAGALGAVIGVAAAALPIFVRGIAAATAEAKPLNEAMKDLDESVGRIGRTFETVNMDSWVDAFNAASEAQEQFLLDTLEFDRYMAGRAQRGVISSLNEQISQLGNQGDISGLGRGQQGRRNAQAERFNEVAEAVGLTKSQLEEVLPLYEKVIGSQGADQDSVVALSASLRDFASGSDEYNEKLEKQIDLTESLFKANVGLAESYDGLLKDVVVTAKRVDQLNSSTGSESDPFSRVVANPGTLEMRKAYEERQKMLKEEEQIMRALYPEVSAYNDQMERLAIARERNLISMPEYIRMSEEAMETLQGEQFSLAAEAVEIFDSSFQTMLDGVLQGTTSIEDGFKSMAKVIIAEMARIAAIKGIASLFGANSDIGSALLGRIGANAKGNAFSGGNVIPFAKGGVVTGPTLFPMAKGAGLMGEAGPEAVMPLTRTASGDLGVKSTGMSVVINNMASGVEVTPRQTDEGLTVDIVTRTLANSIRQGGNPLTDALEGSYSLGRGGSVY